jgi:hypothetical protein
MMSLLQGCRFCLTSFSLFWIRQKKLSASVLEMVPLDQKYAHANLNTVKKEIANENDEPTCL